MLMEPDMKEEELVFWEEKGQWEGVSSSQGPGALGQAGVPTQPRAYECPLVDTQRTDQD